MQRIERRDRAASALRRDLRRLLAPRGAHGREIGGVIDNHVATRARRVRTKDRVLPRAVREPHRLADGSGRAVVRDQRKKIALRRHERNAVRAGGKRADAVGDIDDAMRLRKDNTRRRLEIEARCPAAAGACRSTPSAR